MKYTESILENATLEWFEGLGYSIAHGYDISPDGDAPERESYDEVVLKGRLKDAIWKLNPTVPDEGKEDALRQVMNLPNLHPSLIENNKAFHHMLVNGVEVEYQSDDGRVKGDLVSLIDKTSLENNDWLAVNQFRVKVIDSNRHRIPDVVAFINGLPLATFELKNPTNEKTTITQAYRQFQTYLHEIPSFMTYNETLVISDGHNANIGTITSPKEWFMKWRSTDGEVISPRSENDLKVLVNGVFEKKRLLDLVTSFITFQESKKGTKKILAGYHQYFATNKAIEHTIEATSENGDRKIGVIWHTQGSGKSLTMAFYTGKLIQELDNPTVVVITDRNDLDGQLCDTFTKSKELFRQIPVQVETTADLKKKLNVASGGVIFTTIQKFYPEGEDTENFELLSDRKNIVVIADEAHRSHYGFQAKLEKEGVSYGFAKYIRDALPNASFVGFTATPIALKDRNTSAIFGDVIDTYDITRAVEDEATVPIYYEARLARIDLDQKLKAEIDVEVEEIFEDEELGRIERVKSRWARLEKLVGSEKRLRIIAKDIVTHFEQRLDVIDGKGMIVTMSRRIAVDLFTEITRLRPQWHNSDEKKGFLKVVMTGSASDPEEYQQHVRSKTALDDLANRMRDENDELKLVIVVDMWLTGFDAPSTHTMYFDKPIEGHNLMQAIARVNRVYKDKKGGLVVDYLGIAAELREALSYYSKSDQNLTAVPQEEALGVMNEKYEVVTQMFHGFNYREYFNSSAGRRTEVQTEAIDFILEHDEEGKRYKQAVTELSDAFSIAIPHSDALAIREDVAFFQAIKAGIVKLSPPESGPTEEDYDHAIKQIISNAIVSGEVVDIFKSVGLDTPNISVLSDEFLAEVQGMEHKNIAFETLRKLLAEEIRSFAKKNLVVSRSFREMLEEVIKRYQERTITSAEVIAELVALAKKLQKEREKGADLGLNEDEVAFYDALADNDNAVKELGNETLKAMAHELLEIIRKEASIDWTKRESIQAKMRISVKRLLHKYDYPPDKQERATQTVLEQAELMAEDWANNN